jgi:hypothetical protein
MVSSNGSQEVQDFREFLRKKELDDTNLSDADITDVLAGGGEWNHTVDTIIQKAGLGSRMEARMARLEKMVAAQAKKPASVTHLSTINLPENIQAQITIPLDHLVEKIKEALIEIGKQEKPVVNVDLAPLIEKIVNMPKPLVNFEMQEMVVVMERFSAAVEALLGRPLPAPVFNVPPLPAPVFNVPPSANIINVPKVATVEHKVTKRDGDKLIDTSVETYNYKD